MKKFINKKPIPCFYGCEFIAHNSEIIESHYQQAHYPKPKEVNHV